MKYPEIPSDRYIAAWSAAAPHAEIKLIVWTANMKVGGKTPVIGVYLLLYLYVENVCRTVISTNIRN